MCVGCFPRGVPGGGRYSPLVTRSVRGNAPKFFLGGFCYFLADLAIFSGLLKIIPVLGIRVFVSTEYLKKLYILYSEW
jgi:hypothetical protein